MDKIFANKVTLITGASYGIGRATAIAFAQRGAKVIVADWIEDKEGTTLKGIKDAGSEGIFVQCDVSKDSDVKSMIDKVISTYGRLDFAFNNAGIEGNNARKEIWINAVCLGVIHTPMIDRTTGGNKEVEQQFVAVLKIVNDHIEEWKPLNILLSRQ